MLVGLGMLRAGPVNSAPPRDEDLDGDSVVVRHFYGFVRARPLARRSTGRNPPAQIQAFPNGGGM
jgi:hypothetical protein